MEYSLKQSTILELELIIAESQDSFIPTRDHPTSDPKGFLQFVSTEERFKIFALNNPEGETAGYISNVNYKDEKETAAIGPMYISEKFRGQGLGELQVKLFIEWAREIGFKKIITKTWSSNKASNKIFTKLGFKIENIKENDRTNGDSTIKYTYTL